MHRQIDVQTARDRDINRQMEEIYTDRQHANARYIDRQTDGNDGDKEGGNIAGHEPRGTHVVGDLIKDDGAQVRRCRDNLGVVPRQNRQVGIVENDA